VDRSPSPAPLERGTGGEVSKRKSPQFSIILSILFTLPTFFIYLFPRGADFLEYDRSRLASGELWRLFTCHLAHWTAEHLLWDLGTVVVLAFACAPLGMRRLGGALGLAAFTIPLAIWIALPAMERYRGLSGLASALFILLTVSILRTARAERRPWMFVAALLALGGFAAKLTWELATASPAFVGADSGFVAVPLAHLVGGVCGGWFASVSRL
jgi:rhomboid family GlyGly-CTERM serine protease